MICTMIKNKINVAEILANKPQRIKLYSPICGEVVFDKIERDLGHYTILVTTPSQTHYAFMEDGKYERYGECLLFPSKEMHSWEKFAWKKGDVLVSNDGCTEVIFDGFTDNTYISFVGKHYLTDGDENGVGYLEEQNCLATQDYHLEEKDAAKCFINALEERLDGKLNIKTLEIEKAQPEFKNGDIILADFGNVQKVFVASSERGLNESYISFISLNLNTKTLDMGYRTYFGKYDTSILRYATEEEKQQLFDALEKEGKRWNDETKMIEDIKPKWFPKSFDKVITSNALIPEWVCDMFSHIDKNGQYVCIGGNIPGKILPYNEETAKLLGTDNEYKENV